MDSAALNHFTHERIELDSQEKELRTEVEKVGEKNRWFSDFKIFIEEVAAFLDEKVGFYFFPLILSKQNILTWLISK